MTGSPGYWSTVLIPDDGDRGLLVQLENSSTHVRSTIARVAYTRLGSRHPTSTFKHQLQDAIKRAREEATNLNGATDGGSA